MSHREDSATEYANTFKKFIADYFHNNTQGKIKFEENMALWRTVVAKNVPQ